MIAAKQILNNRSSRYWENPVRYCANELAALEATLQPAQTMSLPLVGESLAEPESTAESQDELSARAVPGSL